MKKYVLLEDVLKILELETRETFDDDGFGTLDSTCITKIRALKGFDFNIDKTKIIKVDACGSCPYLGVKGNYDEITYCCHHEKILKNMEVALSIIHYDCPLKNNLEVETQTKDQFEGC